MKLHTNFLLLEHGFRIQFCGHLFLYRESKAIYRYSGLPLLSFDVVYNLRKKKMASHGQVSFSFYGLTQAHSFCGSSPTPNPPPPPLPSHLPYSRFSIHPPFHPPVLHSRKRNWCPTEFQTNFVHEQQEIGLQFCRASISFFASQIKFILCDADEAGGSCQRATKKMLYQTPLLCVVVLICVFICIIHFLQPLPT